jgi:hypothetical protein
VWVRVGEQGLRQITAVRSAIVFPILMEKLLGDTTPAKAQGIPPHTPTYIHMHISTRAPVCTHAWVWVSGRLGVNEERCAHTQIAYADLIVHARVYVCLCLCACVCVCVCVCVCDSVGGTAAVCGPCTGTVPNAAAGLPPGTGTHAPCPCDRSGRRDRGRRCGPHSARPPPRHSRYVRLPICVRLCVTVCVCDYACANVCLCMRELGMCDRVCVCVCV